MSRPERGFIGNIWFNRLSMRHRRAIIGASGAVALASILTVSTVLTVEAASTPSTPYEAACEYVVTSDPNTAWGIAEHILGDGRDGDPRDAIYDMEQTEGNPSDLAGIKVGQVLRLDQNLCFYAKQNNVQTQPVG